MKEIFNNFKSRDLSKIGKSNVISSEAMLACSHPIAASVGINILKSGGNAVDAAIAMNAVLCVAEPHMTGVGGDCFAMLSVDGSTEIQALHGSGKSSQNASAENLRNQGFSVITPDMPDAITIPGAVAGWSLLHKEHGYMPWNEIFSPAIEYAKSGIHVHERVASDWYKNTYKVFNKNYRDGVKELQKDKKKLSNMKTNEVSYGAKIKEHWLGEKNLVTKNLIETNSYSKIIFQDHSMNPIIAIDSTKKYYTQFKDLIP